MADDVEHRLDPRSVMVGRIAAAIAVGVLAGAPLVVLAGMLLFSDLPAALELLLPVGWLALSAALAAWAWFWPPLRYRYASYRVSSRGIQIREGVVWRAVISVPRSRVQHTDVAQGPLARGFGLATLTIHTAGTQHASVSLGGLSKEAAQAIRDHLIAGGEDDAV